MKVPGAQAGKPRLDLDVVTSGSVQDEVTRLVEAGAQVIEVRHDPFAGTTRARGR